MAERPPNPLDRIDILRGAIDARVHPQVGSSNAGEPRSRRSARVGAIPAMVGGPLWVAAALAFHRAPFNTGLGYKESGSAIIVAVAAGLLTAVAGLLLARSCPGRQGVLWTAAIGALLCAVALALPWPIMALGFFGLLVATLVLGLVVTPFLGSTGLLLAIAAVIAMGFNTEDDRALYLIPLGLAWLLLGIVLAVRGMPAAVEQTGEAG
jgi:hypothetical protein